MSIELTKADKERLRRAWSEMYGHIAENLSDSPSPHSQFLTILNERMFQLQRIENAEAEVAELKSEAEKLAEKVRSKLSNLSSRLNRLQQGEVYPRKNKQLPNGGYEAIEIDNPPPDCPKVIVVPTEILEKYARKGVRRGI